MPLHYPLFRRFDVESILRDMGTAVAHLEPGDLGFSSAIIEMPGLHSWLKRMASPFAVGTHLIFIGEPVSMLNSPFSRIRQRDP